MTGDPYIEFKQQISQVIATDRIFDDPLQTLALGTDASFYRLIPRLAIQADSENEVSIALQAAHRFKLPVTFRAAGTSLSGQAVTDSILLIAGGSWNHYSIEDNGSKIRLQPGVIGGHANRYLASYGRKIGPDPASINAAMIGGIAANNASGMCCGTAENSYRTVSSMRTILADGTLLNTGDTNSREAFRRSHPEIIDALQELAVKTQANESLRERIRHKFKIKNTTGYSLNALVDYTNPFDIINHLMIGSEGTLGFIAEITYDTVIEHPHKASALMMFPDVNTACRAIPILRAQEVAAAELMDRASLRSVQDKAGMPDYLKSLPEKVTALLVEVRAASKVELTESIDGVHKALAALATERPFSFTDDPDAFNRLWNIRKGLFPAVGAVRAVGTTVVIEDVAFPFDRLAEAALDLQDLFKRHHYHEAIIFGHALEGNLHFVFTQDFASQKEVKRYQNFMQDVCDLVVKRYDGSLKAEHGTGRNMAPFVEMEWGREAYELMQKIKAIFDPHNILNPGVILNENPHVHLEHLKPLPATNQLVDKCIECGFCEATCPSKDLTLTPRQRIALQREISRLQRDGANQGRLQYLTNAYRYPGEQTCAADGLCAVSCPVDIDTGKLTKYLRSLDLQASHIQSVANWMAGHFDKVSSVTRLGLATMDAAHRLLGTEKMQRLADQAHKLSGNRLPLWNPFMPRRVSRPQPGLEKGNGRPVVVYFPSCVARTMGPAADDPDRQPLYEITSRILAKAGYKVVLPENLDRLCCGTPFESKGLPDQANRKLRELETALMAASDGGERPIICDTSPCLYRIRQNGSDWLQIYDPIEFIHDFVLDRLRFTQSNETIALHATCSSIKMGLEGKLQKVANMCAKKVITPDRVGCCAFAGDRGFSFPELNASALQDLKPSLAADCTAGYSNSRTCEIGLSLHSGIYYKSLLYLIDRCTQPSV